MTNLLHRAAQHEAGHCIAALHFTLPLLKVTVNGGGSGKTEYARRFTVAEVEAWVVATHCGPLAEALRFGDAPADGDEEAAARALADLDLSWNASRMDGFRERARMLVARERRAIAALARRAGLSDAEVMALVPDVRAAPLWVT